MFKKSSEKDGVPFCVEHIQKDIINGDKLDNLSSIVLPEGSIVQGVNITVHRPMTKEEVEIEEEAYREGRREYVVLAKKRIEEINESMKKDASDKKRLEAFIQNNSEDLAH